jgi:hypothetical protein
MSAPRKRASYFPPASRHVLVSVHHDAKSAETGLPQPDRDISQQLGDSRGLIFLRGGVSLSRRWCQSPFPVLAGNDHRELLGQPVLDAQLPDDVPIISTFYQKLLDRRSLPGHQRTSMAWRTAIAKSSSL